ncbi:MAG TPA: 16S rRNA (guanine(966)-N(2))-methyltransferase RsmD [Nitrospirae bacterium]|nr:16S rRNA (guanine(966)-N(2))-methyltransferase RsmD [Nitrospirota bacterium]
MPPWNERYTVKITGGKERGRKIPVKTASARAPLRPTSAKVKEALFNILGQALKGSRFLDLYAGTGAVGMEALSRGAREAVFVEINKDRCRLIKEISERLGYEGRIRVHRMDARRYLERARQRGETFDQIFIDPPYQSGEIKRILPLISDGLILSEDGIIIIEHSSKITLPEESGNLRKGKTYRYGDTSLTIYRLYQQGGKIK